MYTINPGSDNTPDEPFTGYRLYWSKSHAGAHLAAYEEGLALGQADLDANGRDNLDALIAASGNPTLDWNAKADGYCYATRKRGSNELRRFIPKD